MITDERCLCGRSKQSHFQLDACRYVGNCQCPGFVLDEARAVCPHAWKPAPGWYARYRCARCRAFGFKQRMVTSGPDVTGKASAMGTEVITPYLCRTVVNGKPCGQPGVAKRRTLQGKGPWMCRAHKDQEKST